MARRRKGDAEGQAAVQTTANQGADTRKRAATKRERVTRAELRERRGHEVKEPKVHVSLRERFASLGDSLRELVQGHPRAVFAVLAVVVAIVMIYGPARGYYVATRTNEELSAYYNALAAQKQCISSDAALTASRTAFNLMQKKYENGKATATEYQESKTNLQKAETTALQSRYTFMFRRKILQFYQGHSISED